MTHTIGIIAATGTSFVLSVDADDVLSAFEIAVRDVVREYPHFAPIRAVYNAKILNSKDVLNKGYACDFEVLQDS